MSLRGAGSRRVFEIEIHDRARKELERLPAKIARAIADALEVLRTDPFSGPNVRRLHGELDGMFRLRVGSYRILYEIDGKGRIVLVTTVGARGQMY